MTKTEQRIYKYTTEDNGVWEKCVQLIVDKLLKSRESREKNHLEIYFSLNDIAWINWVIHFLQEYAANEMHDCQIEQRPFRSKEQLLACTDYDDSIEDYLKGIWLLENYIYVWEDDSLKLKSADLKKNTISSVAISEAKDFSIFNEVCPPYRFVTSSNLLLRVGWWQVHLPDNFMYRLLKNQLISKEWYIKISEHVYVNLNHWILVWEKRDKFVKKLDWKRKTRQFSIIENLMLYQTSGSQYAVNFLMKCTKPECDEIVKMFGEISEDDVVAKRGWMLQFL